MTAHRLLLVEDEPSLARTVSDRLVAEGYDVRIAARRAIGRTDGRRRRLRSRPARRSTCPARTASDVCRDLRPARPLDPDPHADRPQRARRPRARPQAGRGRLPGQAVRNAGAAGANRSAAAAKPDRDAGGWRGGCGGFRTATASAASGSTSTAPRCGASTTATPSPSVACSALEYRLLRFLIENRGEVHDRNRLLDEVWGYDRDAGDPHRRRPCVVAAAEGRAEPGAGPSSSSRSTAWATGFDG